MEQVVTMPTWDRGPGLESRLWGQIDAISRTHRCIRSLSPDKAWRKEGQVHAQGELWAFTVTHIWLRTMIKATCKQQPQPRVTRCRGLMRTPKEGVDLAGLSQHRVEMRPGCTGAGEPRVVSVITMSLCLVAQSCPTLATTWTAARQAPLSMEFSRQESWSGLPFPAPTKSLARS